MEVVLIDSKVLLVSGSQSKAECVNNGGFSGVIFTDNGGKPRVERHHEGAFTFSKGPEILNTKLR
jgi:hypothetical protein